MTDLNPPDTIERLANVLHQYRWTLMEEDLALIILNTLAKTGLLVDETQAALDRIHYQTLAQTAENYRIRSRDAERDLRATRSELEKVKTDRDDYQTVWVQQRKRAEKAEALLALEREAYRIGVAERTRLESELTEVKAALIEIKDEQKRLAELDPSHPSFDDFALRVCQNVEAFRAFLRGQRDDAYQRGMVEGAHKVREAVEKATARRNALGWANDAANEAVVKIEKDTH